jgi:caffeoyl-CoA O-methyltransferase
LSERANLLSFKENQLEYYELCMQLIHTGNFIAVDNVLWGVDVADPANQQEDAVAIRSFNEFVYRDMRFDTSLG